MTPQKNESSAKNFERIETDTPKSSDQNIDGYRIDDIFSKARTDEDIVDTDVTCDSTWQRLGFSSLNGCYVDTGKVLDTEVMSRYCKGCKTNEKLKKSDPKNLKSGTLTTSASLTMRDQLVEWK